MNHKGRVMAAIEHREPDRVPKGEVDILSTCNTLIRAIPPENARAMYEVGEKYGSYPIAGS